MGVTLVGEDDVIGTENNSILVPSFVISMPLLAFLTKFPFVSTPANRVGLCEVSIGVDEETKFLLRMFINIINHYHYVSDNMAKRFAQTTAFRSHQYFSVLSVFARKGKLS